MWDVVQIVSLLILAVKFIIDPVESFVEKLKNQKNINKNSYFNNFGLGNDNKELYYYPKHESFYDRVNSCGIVMILIKFYCMLKKGLIM